MEETGLEYGREGVAENGVTDGREGGGREWGDRWERSGWKVGEQTV